MSEYLGEFVVGLSLYIIGSTVAAIKTNSTMKEQIKTLFSRYDKMENRIDSIEYNHDVAIKEIKSEMKSLSDALQDGNKNIVEMVHDLHIKLIENKKGSE
jgi:prefoldin subunit 5